MFAHQTNQIDYQVTEGHFHHEEMVVTAGMIACRTGTTEGGCHLSRHSPRKCSVLIHEWVLRGLGIYQINPIIVDNPKIAHINPVD